MIFILVACSTPDQPEILAEQKPIAPQVRLLSRREYRNTIMDVLGVEVPSGQSCQQDSDCDLETESCRFQQCIVDDCSTTTFTYEGAPNDEVYVLGSFSNWTTDPYWGAWKMEWDEAKGLHYIKGDILPKHITEKYRYQFSVNGEEIADPQNDVVEYHNGEPYSVMRVLCSTNGRYETDPTDGFPAESRGPGFHFDHQSSRGIVTSGHLERYIRSADWISQTINLETLSSCTLDSNSAEEICIADVVSSLGAKLFRRQLRADEQQKYIASYENIRPEYSAEDSYREIVFLMLSSPYFLYRTEVGDVTGEHRILNNNEIASAMSYFLWGSSPDTTLLQLAEEGKLHDAAVRKEQAERMLSSHKAHRHAKDFFSYWLGTQGLRNLSKDLSIYPGFTPDLTVAFEREIESYAVELMLQETATYKDFFAREKSYLNQRLAFQYDIFDLYGPNIRLATVPEERQGGLLGTGAWLSAHSTENKSSPFRRGTAVRERILCQELPEPPAIAGVTPEPNEETSNQQRFEAHSSNAQCYGCHVYIDGVGLPLERFDADGTYRKRENGHLISTEGELWDIDYMGQNRCDRFEGLRGLADLLAESNQGPNCFVRQVFRSAIGEVETPAQELLIRNMTEKFTQEGGSTRKLLIDMVADSSFITRRLEEE